jgi:glycosyltransferase involved in cell wall biosynthesis
MNLCFLLPPSETYSPVDGGPEATWTMQIGRRLAAGGHDLTVLASAGKEAAYPVGSLVPIVCPTRQSLSLARRGVSALRQRLGHWDWPFYEYYLASVRKALRGLQSRPDALLVFNDLLTPRCLKRDLPKAKLLSVLTRPCATRQPDIRKTIAAVHRLVATGQCLRDWTAQRYGIDREKMAVVAGGADLETFQPRPGFLGAAAPLKALFIGPIDPGAGPDLAADAVAQLRKEGVAITLTVASAPAFAAAHAGGAAAPAFLGDLRKKLAAASAEYAERVSPSEAPALIRRHDVACILPRDDDPMPQAAVEAMASGLAVVVSDRGGACEACDGAGWQVKPDDPQTIAGALRTLAAIPPVLNEYKRRSIAQAAQRTWEASAAALEAILLN